MFLDSRILHELFVGYSLCFTENRVRIYMTLTKAYVGNRKRENMKLGLYCRNFNKLM